MKQAKAEVRRGRKGEYCIAISLTLDRLKFILRRREVQELRKERRVFFVRMQVLAKGLHVPPWIAFHRPSGLSQHYLIALSVFWFGSRPQNSRRPWRCCSGSAFCCPSVRPAAPGETWRQRFRWPLVPGSRGRLGMAPDAEIFRPTPPPGKRPVRSRPSWLESETRREVGRGLQRGSHQQQEHHYLLCWKRMFHVQFQHGLEKAACSLRLNEYYLQS